MKVPDLRKLSGLSGWVRNVNPGVLLKKEAERELTGRREEGHVPQRQNAGMPALRRSKGPGPTPGKERGWGCWKRSRPSPQSPGGSGPCPHLDFSPAMLIPNLPSGMLREETCVVLSHEIHSDL